MFSGLSLRLVAAGGTAAAAGAVLLALRRRWTRTLLACPTRMESLTRYYDAAKEHWRIRLKKPAHPSVAATIKKRIEFSRGIKEVYRECRCGAIRISVRQGGPLFTTICHCGMCKAHNFNEGYTNICFTAVKRDACVLEGNEQEKPLVWVKTSEQVRRGRCGKCGSALLYDNKWFEPSTMWLCDAKVVMRDGEQKEMPAIDLPLLPFSSEVVKNPSGTYDADVRWDCQHIITEAVPWDPAGEIPQEIIKDVIAKDEAPRGRAHFTWPGYYVDPGKL